jgi:predicted amidohydrolase
MTGGDLALAMVTDVFFGAEAEERLVECLRRARDLGASLAVLPELPLNAWAPATKVAQAGDAEGPDGPRQQLMSAAARDVGIGLVGGAIVRDPASGARHNTAFVFDGSGRCVLRYRKVHLPEEEGYWETSHYEPGDDAPSVTGRPDMCLGVQICSDVNRPTGFQLLAAQGAEVVCVPRATPPETYERWRLVLRANAVMSGTFVVSVNRPGPEAGAPIGGPSIAIAPNGSVLAETDEAVHVVTLRGADLAQARRDYPGYLERFPELYARSWGDVTARTDWGPA